MGIKSSVGLAVGPVNATHWGQVLVLPNGYGIIEIEDSLGNAQRVGVAILSQTGALLSRGLSSLKAVEDVAGQVVNSHMRTLILLVPVGNVVYLVIRGQGVVYVKRGSELASLMHEDGAISGEVKDGDTFLLASQGFSTVLSHEELTGLFDHLSPADVAEKLTLLLHEKTGGEGSVALVFGISEFAENPIEKDPSADDKNVEEEKEGDESQKTAGAGDIGTWRDKVASLYRRMGKLVSFRARASDMRAHPRKMTAFFAMILVFLFIASVFLGIWKQATAKKNQQVISAISDSQHAMEEGVALLELNPVKGRERLSQAKQLLEPFVQTVSPRTVEGVRVATLYRQITDNLTHAMQVVESPLTLYYDVSLLKKGAVASFLARDGDQMAIADQVTNTVYQLNIASKNAQIAGGGQPLKNLSVVGVHGDMVYMFTPEGIVELRLGDKKVTLLVKKDEAWGTITSLVVFGGNLYLLDIQKSRIWKYVGTDAGFSETREYLNPDTLPDLSQATGMAIDGSVWMGTTSGKILRFTQGKENTFIVKGIDPPFGTRLVVYTSDDTVNLYVLDTQSNRVVVLDKEGMYLAQYRFDSAKAPTGLVVSEERKKMLLLADGKLYGIDLK